MYKTGHLDMYKTDHLNMYKTMVISTCRKTVTYPNTYTCNLSTKNMCYVNVNWTNYMGL